MDFKQEYIEEVKLILKSLEQSIMVLDKQPNNTEEIDNVYRFLHTVKGSAGMFEFHTMEKLTHELEFVYSDIRDGIRALDENILDLTLHAIDVLSDLIEGNDADNSANQIIDSIANILGKSNDEVITEKSNKSASIKAFGIVIFPTDSFFKRGVNFNAILEDFSELDHHEITFHNESTPFENQMTSKNLTSTIEVLAITSGGLESIEDIMMFLNTDEYKIIEINNESDFNSDYAKSLGLNVDDIADRASKFESMNAEIFKNSESETNTIQISDIKSLVNDIQNEVESDSVEIQKSSKKSHHVNVSTEKLDGLINIVSELVTFRSEIQHLLSNQKNTKISEAVEKLEYLTLRLRDSAFNIRLVPINIINVKLQRLIRSVSKDLSKEVEFITEGLDTELDRSIINALEAPLMHIIRNSLDHGIENPEERIKRNKPEKGLLKLYSYNSGDHVFIQIQDDGNGINFEKIKAKGIEKGLLETGKNYTEKELINVMMSPGFSTADEITKVSGRGVGMDIVKKEINALRGDIEVSTEEGLGTIITLRLPLTLTILDTLVVDVAEQKYLIPINEIEYCYEEEHSNLFKKKGRQVNYNGELTPFVSLREYFGQEEYPSKETVVVVNKNDTKMALVVDKIVGQYQTVYKPLNELLQPIDCFSGSSILGDGSTALILNALKLKN